MQSNKIFFLCLAAALSLTGCGGGSSGGSNPQFNDGVSLPAMSGDNVLSLTVNGGNCSSNSYANKPCVAVTICSPTSPSSCVTVNDVLLDTGSYGLRLFKSTLGGLSFTQVTGTGGNIAECIAYGDGSTQWGPVQQANVQIAGEPVLANFNIQVIDSSFGTIPTACDNADATPATAGLNGILGVGVLDYDCGNGCSTGTPNSNPQYYACDTNGNCTITSVSSGANQVVENPAAAFTAPTGQASPAFVGGSTRDNNGVVIALPGLVDGGQLFANGYVIFGVGTRTNNTPGASVQLYKANASAQFSTTFNGQSPYTHSFLDTGSNGLFFPQSGYDALVDCQGWFCPTSLLNLTALMAGVSGSSSGNVSFKVGNFANLNSTANEAFAELGGEIDSSNMFDWGLPFFFGRTTYVGITGKVTSVNGVSNGSSPFWAF